MANSIDLIASKIAECAERIENYKRKIFRLRQTILDISCRALEVDDGEITHFNDID